MVENNKIIIYLLYMYKGENLSNFCNRNPGTGTDAESPLCLCAVVSVTL